MSRLKFVQKVIVDADNKFEFIGLHYQVSDKVKEYRVYNSYKDNGTSYTNESQMSIINVYIDIETNKIHFLNEHNKEITKIVLVEE